MLNNGQIEMRVLIVRATNVTLREDESLENRAIHGLKDRIERSKLEIHTLFNLPSKNSLLVHHLHFSISH